MSGKEALQEQLVFDFSRGSQLRRLDRAQLPKPPNSWQVSAAAMKAVLRSIDSLIQKARLSSGTPFKLADIAAAANLNRATVNRAIAGLERLCLLSVTRTGRESIYQVVWANLEDVVPLPPDCPAANSVRHQKAHHAPSEGAGCAIRGRKAPLQKAHGAPSDGAPCAFTLPIGAITQIPPPPLSGWEAVAAELRELGIGEWEACLAKCRERGEAPAAALAAVQEYRTGRAAGRYAAAGALVYRLRSGQWPAAKESPTGPRRPSRESRRLVLDAAVRQWAKTEGWLDDEPRVLGEVSRRLALEGYGGEAPQSPRPRVPRAAQGEFPCSAKPLLENPSDGDRCP